MHIVMGKLLTTIPVIGNHLLVAIIMKEFCSLYFKKFAWRSQQNTGDIRETSLMKFVLRKIQKQNAELFVSVRLIFLTDS